MRRFIIHAKTKYVIDGGLYKVKLIEQSSVYARMYKD